MQFWTFGCSQLQEHAPAHAAAVRRLPRPGLRDRRRARPRVRLRGRGRQHRRGGRRARRHLADRARPRPSARSTRWQDGPAASSGRGSTCSIATATSATTTSARAATTRSTQQCRRCSPNLRERRGGSEPSAVIGAFAEAVRSTTQPCTFLLVVPSMVAVVATRARWRSLAAVLSAAIVGGWWFAANRFVVSGVWLRFSAIVVVAVLVVVVLAPRRSGPAWLVDERVQVAGAGTIAFPSPPSGGARASVRSSGRSSPTRRRDSPVSFRRWPHTCSGRCCR